ncbi:hypothetical protein OH687_29355 [Burkholderia anthina]|nr:hypothetical protein OH687_29355 [Burkholderia anthina]
MGPAKRAPQALLRVAETMPHGDARDGGRLTLSPMWDEFCRA